MQDEAGFYAPLQYQPLWMWLGLALLVLVAGWYAWILRPSPRPRPQASSLQQPDLSRLRSQCLAAIDAVVSDADAGRLPERAAHQELSRLVREFAGTATGLRVTSMTLEELRHNGLEPVAAGIAGIYPNEFAPAPVHSVPDSADAARQAVRTWN
ncbi:hypothetical protein ACIQC5_14360 [Paenarthrobacter sp. NPDC092416]|uniref:hypothetical protein n=1 Tax=Paenarthrobacter sp. NPDC092416 TaxID=3364386 RepID=UPI003817342B